MSQPAAHGESSWRPLRLIHASDLHLDRPPHGMVDDPDHLRPQLVNCPYDAALNVFDAAVVDSVDALILSGNVVDIDLAGSRAIVFLQSQFARLAEKKIPIFWAGGASDPPGAWPPAAPLPSNVHVFPAGRIESHTILRDGKPVARVVGTSVLRGEAIPLERLRRDSDALLTIGVACGDLAPEAFKNSHVDYLALGGQNDRKTYTLGRQAIHFPGTPQGRSPKHPGQRSCTLVEIDHEGAIAMKAIATDTVRFHTESIEVPTGMTIAALESKLHDRVKALVAKAGERDLIVTWRLDGEGRSLEGLGRGGAEGAISRLRERFGHKSPALWSVELVVEPSTDWPEDWFTQETILGDVMRKIRELEKQPTATLDLSTYMSETDREGQLGTLADLSIDGRRTEILRNAATLGAELLAGSAPTAGSGEP